MATGGIGGFGTKIVGSSNFTATTGMGEVIKIDLPELGMTDIDVSSMDSAENFMQFLGGSVDPGLIDIETNYDDDAESEFNAALGVSQTYTITFPDSSTYATIGYLNKAGGGTAGTNEKITRVSSIKCSGKPTATISA